MKFLTILFIFMSGCISQNVVFTPVPRMLPNAVKGLNYISSVEIKGGAISKNSITVKITPVDSGFVWKPRETKDFFEGRERVKEDYHHITIYGTPKKQGVVFVEISGFTLGTSFSGKGFNKEYRVEVVR